jgi:hypothetical protein
LPGFFLLLYPLGLGGGVKASKRFFFEKKNQKTFIPGFRRLRGESEAMEACLFDFALAAGDSVPNE